ncbi:unnamed protein product [Allacma fusca]|uniref:Uncharacterized protein n=1 Tax=Allacma fusca TaxID=39272 RepID=A0A8J2KFW2_9HEXA|nr:unnamed protein product [Allacma fusca]
MTQSTGNPIREYFQLGLIRFRRIYRPGSKRIIKEYTSPVIYPTMEQSTPKYVSTDSNHYKNYADFNFTRHEVEATLKDTRLL